MQQTPLSQDELNQVCRDLLAQADDVKRKWRKALTQCSPHIQGRADLVRYVRFIVRVVGETAKVFAKSLENSGSSPEQLQNLWETAQQGKKTLNVLSAQCDDFVRKNTNKPDVAVQTGGPRPGFAACMRQLREQGRALADKQKSQALLVMSLLGHSTTGRDKLASRALVAMMESISIESQMLRRRRLNIRTFARSKPAANRKNMQRVEQWQQRNRGLGDSLESRERYLAHLIGWQ